MGYDTEPQSSPQMGGYWLRLLAGLMDLILIVAIVAAAAWLGVRCGVYLPIELTVVVAGVVYTIACEARTGQTIGKWLCGLIVTTRDGEAPGVGRLLLRETIGKLVSFLPLGAGFLWCGFTRKKQAWHDSLARTVVVRRPAPFGRWGQMAVALFVAGVLVFALDVPGWILFYRDAVAFRSPKPVHWRFEQRDPKELTEVKALSPSQQDADVAWLHDHATNAVEYVVATAQKHQVLVFGEQAHEKKEFLDFLNASIPQLYQRAGVTCVAMEVCLAEDNENLRRLVIAPQFNRELALQIARHEPWGIWGFKEYWDVFETVWRVNQTIPAGQRKIRVIGLDSPMDAQSVGMTIGEGENPSKQCPLWEKLRVARLFHILPKVAARDVRMAGEIQREILASGEHAVVWVGAEHAWACPQPVSNGHRVSRMGALLRQRYGDKLFFIRLPGFDIPASWIDRNYHGSDPLMASTIEATMQQSGLTGVGFDTAESPLGLLRDSAIFDYHFEARLGLGDIVDGYVYLKPWRQL
ncbi:MAG: RDD family protein, partial [Bryobacteraceae bacterium]